MDRKNRIPNAAVRLVLPVTEREARIEYLQQYSCKPPPLFLLAISLVEVGIFVWDVVELSNDGKSVGPDGPARLNNPLIFWPSKKYEPWCFITYMFVHNGYSHIVGNLLVQLFLGIPLEMVHRWWRVMLIYLSGVIAGSLASSLFDPTTPLVGASGGVYALVCAHLANVIMNWSEMTFPAFRLIAFLVIASVDTGQTIYTRYSESADNQVSYVAHIAGATVGVLLGIVVLHNLRVTKWEKVVWWCILVAFLGLLLTAIIANIAIYITEES